MANKDMAKSYTYTLDTRQWYANGTWSGSCLRVPVAVIVCCMNAHMPCITKCIACL